MHIPHSTSEQVESESERGKGEIISILSDLCFSAFFMDFIPISPIVCRYSL